MKMLRLVAGLALVASAAQAQLAVTQPTERLLVLPLGVRSTTDSAISIQVADAVRERLSALARYKAIVITKAKLCEALEASGFPCNVILDDQQAQQLARFLSAHAYNVGELSKDGATWTARVRMIDIASSGFASAFRVTNGNPGTPAALAEAIAQRAFTVIKAGESVRQCNTERQRGGFVKAVQAAQKAIAIDSSATAAYVCILNTYEAQHFSPDSAISVAKQCLRGDSLFAPCWERYASAMQQKHDTAGVIDANKGRLRANPRSIPFRMGLAQLLLQNKRYQDAADILSEGLTIFPSDPGMIELKRRVCIEGALWHCAVESLLAQANQDSTVLGDSSWQKTAIGAAQKDSQDAGGTGMRQFTRWATDHFPRSTSFWKARATGYEKAGLTDSVVWAYRKALEIDPTDIATSLLVAKALLDAAVWDTAGPHKAGCDTACATRLRNAYADRLDTAKAFLSRGLASPDSGLRLSATAILFTGGSKLAQAQAYARAYPWLDSALTLLAPRGPADTAGPRQLLRGQASFWYGVSSTLSLAGPYGDMVRAINDKNMPQPRKCEIAKAVADRIARTKDALIRGGRIAPAFAQQMLGILARYEDQLPRVKQAAKCTNF